MIFTNLHPFLPLFSLTAFCVHCHFRWGIIRDKKRLFHELVW